jgi:hypothetical protein
VQLLIWPPAELFPLGGSGGYIVKLSNLKVPIICLGASSIASAVLAFQPDGFNHSEAFQIWLRSHLGAFVMMGIGVVTRLDCALRQPDPRLASPLETKRMDRGGMHVGVHRLVCSGMDGDQREHLAVGKSPPNPSLQRSGLARR